MSIDSSFVPNMKKEITDAKGAADLTKITGYDATKVQTLKNDEGTIKWVTDETPAAE